MSTKKITQNQNARLSQAAANDASVSLSSRAAANVDEASEYAAEAMAHASKLALLYARYRQITILETQEEIEREVGANGLGTEMTDVNDEIAAELGRLLVALKGAQSELRFALRGAVQA